MSIYDRDIQRNISIFFIIFCFSGERFESDYKEYDESTLPATAIGMVSSDYKECFQAEYKQLRIRYEKEHL